MSKLKSAAKLRSEMPRRFGDYNNKKKEWIPVECDSSFAHFRNVDDSVEDVGRFLRDYRKSLGDASTTTYPCSVLDCERKGTHGGHVFFEQHSGMYIVPLCPKHNNPARKNYYHNRAKYAAYLYDFDPTDITQFREQFQRWGITIEKDKVSDVKEREPTSKKFKYSHKTEIKETSKEKSQKVKPRKSKKNDDDCCVM